MSENRKQGNAQIPREAIKGGAGLDAEYELGMTAIQEKDEKGKIVVTNLAKCKEPIEAMKIPDFSNVKAHTGGLEITLNKGQQETSERG